MRPEYITSMGESAAVEHKVGGSSAIACYFATLSSMEEIKLRDSYIQTFHFILPATYLCIMYISMY